MALKIIFCSCLVAAIAYLTYQELAIITDSYSVKIVVPAKKSDVFRLLLDPKFVPLKFHPMCAGVSNITSSPEQDSSKTFHYINHERIPVLPLFNISHVITFQVNVTVIEENVVFQNKIHLIGGILQIRQHWYVADSKNGNGDETLLEDHFEFTTARVLSRVVMRLSPPAHKDMLENIRQHFVETSKGPHDNIST